MAMLGHRGALVLYDQQDKNGWKSLPRAGWAEVSALLIVWEKAKH